MKATNGEINPKLLELKGVKQFKQLVHGYIGLGSLWKKRLRMVSADQSELKCRLNSKLNSY